MLRIKEPGILLSFVTKRGLFTPLSKALSHRARRRTYICCAFRYSRFRVCHAVPTTSRGVFQFVFLVDLRSKVLFQNITCWRKTSDLSVASGRELLSDHSLFVSGYHSSLYF
jgi:hypothetical protein